MKKKRVRRKNVLGRRRPKLREKTSDPFRKRGILEATFYSWKTKHGGLKVSQGATAIRGPQAGRRGRTCVVCGCRSSGLASQSRTTIWKASMVTSAMDT